MAKRRRDAETGRFISEEQAATKLKETWIEEFTGRTNKQKILKHLYEQLLAHAGYAECEDFESVKVEWVTKIFKKAGLKVD